jgi:hypothetical protein
MQGRRRKEVDRAAVAAKYNLEPMMSDAEAAAYLRVGPEKIRDLCIKCVLTGGKAGKRSWIVTAASVKAYAAQLMGVLA